MNKNLNIRDFIPPIVIRVIRGLRNRNRNDHGAASDFLVPFADPLLNSHSQFNEDLLISLLFDLNKPGFYLDIGANDPTINNNTKRFYDLGWSGINVEPVAEKFEQLCAERSRDQNLNVGIGPENGFFTFYYVVGDSTLSSFDRRIAHGMAKKFGLKVEERQVRVFTLEEFSRRHLSSRTIELMSLDAEGLDLVILKSNDWAVFRPMVLLVEIDKAHGELVSFMRQQRYRLLYNNYHNGIFVDEDRLSAGLFRLEEATS